MNSEKYFFFVRHGETDWNQRQLCQGQKDISLNEKGLLEAKAFAATTENLPLAWIVSSPLKRALQTAQEISLFHPSAPLQIIPEWAERSWGKLEGMPSEQMYEIEQKEEADPHYVPEKSVESRTAFRQRILRGLSLAQNLHPHPLIVSHGRVFLELCYLLNLPPIRQIPNCQLVELRFHSNRWTVVR